jgi:predicted RNA binding protein YcfA (HicA-like mRNA interferase family)
MANFYRDLIRILQKGGFELKRQGKGDHEIWWHPQLGKHVTVDHGIKSRGTANAILKEAGLPKQF